MGKLPLRQRKSVMLRLNRPHGVDTTQEIEDFLHPGSLTSLAPRPPTMYQGLIVRPCSQPVGVMTFSLQINLCWSFKVRKVKKLKIKQKNKKKQMKVINILITQANNHNHGIT